MLKKTNHKKRVAILKLSKIVHLLGVGKLVAEEILEKESELLKPFRFNRYANSQLHPTSHRPFPWA